MPFIDFSVFRKRFLFVVGGVTVGVFLLAVILNGGTGEIRSSAAALVAAVYALAGVSASVALLTSGRFRRWALMPPAKLGRASVLVVATILGGTIIAISCGSLFLQLSTRG